MHNPTTRLTKRYADRAARREGRGGKESWLVRLERRLLFFFGPAQVGKVGRQPGRSANRTAGVQGQWSLRRDSTGRTYLVKPDEADRDDG